VFSGFPGCCLVWTEVVIKFIERFREWKHRRFLRKHGCTTQRQYDLKYDPDYNIRGRRLKREQYHGYAHVFILAPQGFRDYGMIGVLPYNDLVDQMMEWCAQNCKDKWRNDWHRIIEDVWIDGEWEENGIAGLDAVCFAFKDGRDFTMFALRWS